MLSRAEAHWCDGCLRGRAPGDGLTADYRCEECDGPEPQWTEHEIERTDAAGIGARRKLAQAAGHKRAATLAGASGIGKFIIVQARKPPRPPACFSRVGTHHSGATAGTRALVDG